MDTSLPDGRRGQILAVALGLTIVAALWLGVASPLADWYRQRDESLAQRRLVLRHMQAVASLLPALQRQAPAARRDTALLPGATDALAAAALQSAAQAMASASGVTLSSMETLPAQPHGAYRQIGLRLSLAAPWPALVTLLRDASTGQPRMLVDDLEVRPVPMRRPDAQAPVSASFTLLAFRRGNGGGP